MTDLAHETPACYPAEAARFLGLVAPGETRFTFQTFDDREGSDGKKLSDPRLTKVLHGTLDEHLSTLMSLNLAGAGIYVTVNQTDFLGRSKANIVKVRSLFVDGDDVERPSEWHCPPTAIVETSSPRDWHAYWRSDDVALDEFEGKQRWLIERYGTDPTVHDRSRVMRLPGFYHMKRHPVMVRIVEVDDRTHPSSCFPTKIVERRLSSTASPDVAPTFDIALIRAALEAIPNPGDHLSRAVSWDLFLRVGMATWAATGGVYAGLALFNEWCRKAPGKYDRRNTIRKWESYETSPPTEITAATLFYMATEADPAWRCSYDNEIEAKVMAASSMAASDDRMLKELKRDVSDEKAASIEKNVTEQVENLAEAMRAQAESFEQPRLEQARPGQQQISKLLLPFLDISGWDDLPVPQQQWVVEDRIPAGHTTLFSGEGAAGKSLIELQRSVAHVLGQKWLGADLKQGRAVFIDAEDGAEVFHKQLADIVRHHAIKFCDLKDLCLKSLVGSDAVLGYFNRRAGTIYPTQLYNELLEMAADLKPVSITIASSANVFAGSEIDRSQVQQFISLLTRIAMASGGSVMLISHPSLTGISTDTGLSESTQWHNSVRARAILKKYRPEDKDGKADNSNGPDTGLRLIEFKKNNYGPVKESIALKYSDGLFLPIDSGSADKAARQQMVDDVFLEVLEILIRQNQDVCPVINAGNYAPTVISNHQRSGTLTKTELAKAQQRLLDRNLIHIEVTGPPSKLRRVLRLGPKSGADEEPM